MKPTNKIVYICQSCGATYAKHQGKCHACSAWNTIIEEVASPPVTQTTWVDMVGNAMPASSATTPKLLKEITDDIAHRFVSPDKELARTLGGGIVAGSLVLIGGEPGIGKSTLLLQLALKLIGQRVLYISGEESEAQIKMRANRLGIENHCCYILNEICLTKILQHAVQLKPQLVIIDSIQTIYTPQVESAAGTVAQVRATTALLLQYAKSTQVPVFLVGHITKEGTLAGPKVLEHMVDTVLQFEGDRHLAYRIVRTIKNRFGTTSELGIYEMQQDGLREVTNPSAMLLSQGQSKLPGVATGVFIEGNRALLVEVQALVTPATYGTPQRATTGFDSKRLNMLLAVLEKRARLRLATQDVFLNIAGGIKVEDPAIDLAVCLAIVSSLQNKYIPKNYCFAAEVGLGGELRSVSRLSQRMNEADRLGFEQIFIADQHNKSTDYDKGNIAVNCVDNIQQMVQGLFYH